VSTGVLLLCTGIGCGVVLAALAAYGIVREGTARRLRKWVTPLGVLLFGVLVGAGALWIDGGAARTTLFEVDAEGSLGVRPTDPAAPVRVFDLPVEHAGVEHELLVDPITVDALDEAEHPVALHVRLDDPQGRPLVDEQLRFDEACDRSGCGWRGWTADFTPSTAEVHRLTMVVLTVDVPAVHVRVQDPEKTDGVRAPGY
jgi:hypothetical protein